jgi:hypothetical protein
MVFFLNNQINEFFTFASVLARPGIRKIHETIIPISKSTP